MDAPRIRIGNQTNYRAKQALKPYDFALQHRFDAFEWFSDKLRGGWGEQDMDAAARLKLKEAAAERGLQFSVHAPFPATPFTAEGDEAIRRSIDFAGDIGAAIVNVHLVTERGHAAFAEALGPLLEHARKVGVRLSVENVPQTVPDDVNAVFAALAKMPEAEGRVGLCLDMGHANLCKAAGNNYVAFVDQLDEQVPIIHWHVHENWGDRDSHLTLFTGPAGRDDSRLRGLVQRLVRRGFQGAAVLEQWPQPPELLLMARDNLRTLIEAPVI